MSSSPKLFVSADELLLDSFKLAKLVLASDWRPDALLALWRGGAPVGIAVHEFLSLHGLPLVHTVLKCASYSGIGQRHAITLDPTDHLFDTIRHCRRVLVIDDIFDTGHTAQAVMNGLGALGVEARFATIFWHLNHNKTDLRPDYYIRQTDRWVVFPHELAGLTPAAIATKSPAISALIGAPIT